jgi:hypothetical protein
VILLFPLGITLFSQSGSDLSRVIVALDGTPTFGVPVGAIPNQMHLSVIPTLSPVSGPFLRQMSELPGNLIR